MSGFKCQMLLSNYNINKRSSLESTEIFQIDVLVVVGVSLGGDSLLTYHFILFIF